MKSDDRSRIIILPMLILASVFGLASCGLRVSKGDARQEIGQVIRIGMDGSEVMKYIDSLEVKGVKPVTAGYVRGKSKYPVVTHDGREVEVEGHIYASFNNGISGHIFFCPSVGAIFYFDKSEKLITYHIDCFG